MRRVMGVLLVAAAAASLAFAAIARSDVPIQPRAMLRAHLDPRIGFPGTVTTELRFAPTTITIGDVSYRARLDVISFRDRGFPPDTFVDMAMVRLGNPSGNLLPVQFHDYSYEPSSPIGFSVAAKTLASATLDSGTAFSPDVMQGTFTAAAAQSSHACTLQGGRTGYIRSSRGTVSWTQFSIDTGTSPFFGVLTSGPVNARLIRDPGCNSPYREYRPRHLPCAGHAVLGTDSRGNGGAAFAIETNYAATRAFEFAADDAVGTVRRDSHFDWSRAPAADLRFHHSAIGARARFLTAGSGFLTGSARFTSHRPPRIGRWHLCMHNHHLHRFRSLTYHGRLANRATPLTAPFDTGDVQLSGLMRAELEIVQFRRYRG